MTLLERLRRLFRRHRPRRPRCSCKHVWRLHSARGCAGRYGIPCECKLNRLGKPIRPVAVVRSA